MTPQERKDVLDGIAARHDGVLRAEDVLAEARTETHPLHGEFNWDDSSAAHAHRLDQARSLIRSVRVEIRVETRTIESVYYVRDPRQRTRDEGYIALPRLRSDAELAAEALRAEIGRASAVLARARDLACALDGNFEAQLSEMTRALEELSGHVRPVLRVA
jgi:hypothetical protein